MRFFFYEIVARIVAFYLLVDSIRELRLGLAERKIRVFNPSLLNWSRWIVDRDVSPIMYWVQIGTRVFIAIACLLIVIFGWWHSDVLPDQVGQ